MKKQFFEAPSTYIGDIQLRVSDLRTSLSFYTDTLGFKLLQKTEKTASLTPQNSEKILITLKELPEETKKLPGKAGLYHIAILLPDRSSLGKILKHFADLKVQLGAADHEVSEALYLNDPDGNGIEVYHDRDPETWEWNENQVNMMVEPLDAEGLIRESDNKMWDGMPEDTVLGHIHLHVHNLTEAADFYQALGFETVCQLGDQAYFMSTSFYHHHIGLNTWAGEGAEQQPKNRPGLEHYSLIFPSENMRRKRIDDLRNKNIEVTEENGSWVTADPSGNKVYLKVEK